MNPPSSRPPTVRESRRKMRQKTFAMFDVFVTMMLEDSPAVMSLGLLCDDIGYSFEWNKEESPSLNKHGQILRCKPENHVPILAVSKEPRVPDDPSKASGDRFFKSKVPSHQETRWSSVSHGHQSGRSWLLELTRLHQAL